MSFLITLLASISTVALAWKTWTPIKNLGNGAWNIALITRLWLQTSKTSNTSAVCVCVFLRVWYCAGVCVCVRECVHAHVFVRACVRVCSPTDICVCVSLQPNPPILSSNDTVCCGWGHGIWTYIHLAFDEQKLRPEERGQHLDQGFTKGNKMKREGLDG